MNIETQMNFKELEQKINDNFLLSDEGIIKLLCATVIANRLQGDPVWLFIIAPPSGLKSELIRALSEVEGVWPLSSLTPQTLISGHKSTSKEASLLFKLKYNAIFTFKDFTTVLELYESARQEILSQLREVYDGQYSKSFGTGADLNWKGKVGFIAGCTQVVDLYQGMLNILGERFVQYRMKQPDRKEVALLAIKKSAQITETRTDLLKAFSEFFKQFDAPQNADLSEEWTNEITDLAVFATLARSGVKRDPRYRDITHIFEPEMPVRFAKQLTLIAKALIVIGEEPVLDRMIVRKIAIDSLPKNRIQVLSFLTKKRSDTNLTINLSLDSGNEEYNELDGQEWTRKSVALGLGLPTTTATRILEDLSALRILERNKKGTEDVWKINDEYIKFFGKYYPNGIT